MEITTDKKPWTVLSLLNSSAGYLLENGFDSPRLTSELLLSHVLHCSRVDLYLNFDKPVSPEERARFKQLFRRRVQHEPVQYILGTTEFMGLSFHVDKRVLIPRPETEVLVEQALALSRAEGLAHILDIGTGSGNIAVSLAHHLPGCNVDAVDSSTDALEVALLNASDHHVTPRVAF